MTALPQVVEINVKEEAEPANDSPLKLYCWDCCVEDIFKSAKVVLRFRGLHTLEFHIYIKKRPSGRQNRLIANSVGTGWYMYYRANVPPAVAI